MPRRSQRSFTCSSLSSPEIYNTPLEEDFLQISDEIRKRRLLFPMPGSPPIRIMEPGTIPPPNTRFNSMPSNTKRDCCLGLISCSFVTEILREEEDISLGEDDERII